MDEEDEEDQEGQPEGEEPEDGQREQGALIDIDSSERDNELSKDQTITSSSATYVFNEDCDSPETNKIIVVKSKSSGSANIDEQYCQSGIADSKDSGSDNY